MEEQKRHTLIRPNPNDAQRAVYALTPLCWKMVLL